GAVPMFLEEARLAARIRHPNVLEVYDVDVVEGELLIAMRWVEGGSLAALVRAFAAEEPIPAALAVRVVHDALRGLHAAHELRTDDGRPAGLVHRDVSPPNLLVDVEGTTFLADFGVVKAADRSLAAATQENVVKGKLGYMAPEQLAGDPSLDRRADVF